MKIMWKTLGVCIGIPLVTGALSALISGGGMADFAALEKPPLSPPGWLFPVVWTVLYILMGVASYLVVSAGAGQKETESALKAYGLQLFFNFWWSVIFFNFELYFFAFVWLLALWALILLTVLRFGRISKPAAYLMLPYLAWVTFAGYLNLGIALLN